jgi:hypothetical protein
MDNGSTEVDHSNLNAVPLRHAVATLAYRAGKVLRGAPPEFAGFRAGETTRTPAEILAHLADLLDWALSLAEGAQVWQDSPPLTWEQGTARFFTALEAFDRRLGSETPIACSAEELIQGPIADSFAHVGQIAMLRRLAGYPVRGENYLTAEIAIGRVGPEQASPKFEF